MTKKTLKEHLKQSEPEQQNTTTSEVTENIQPDALAQALSDCEAWKDKAMRAQAEMENLRKRMAHDMENHLKFSHAGFAKDLLPVADCLSNALECAKKETASQPDNSFLTNMITGLEMVQKQLTDALKKHGVEKMMCIGTVFDPNLHQVISQIDVPETPSGTIVQEMQAGYTIGNERVLREAMVIVAK